MLQVLKIKNLALIDEVKIEWEGGFNALTGETGAGKSIIIDALNFIGGARGDKTLIKNNTEYVFVEAVFSVSEDFFEIQELLQTFELEVDETIILTRKFTTNGKNECRYNGEIITLGMLKKICGLLIDVFGQHEHQLLLDAKNHISVLDGFIFQTNLAKEFSFSFDKYKKTLSDLRETNLEIKKYGGNESERAREIELLNFQIAEIEEMNLFDGEDDELLDARRRMQTDEKLAQGLQEIVSLISYGDAFGTIKSVLSQLNLVEQYDEKLLQQKEKLSTIRYELDDIFETIKDKRDRTNYSEIELNKVEERIQLIKDAKRKYGKTIADIFDYLQNCQEKLTQLVNADAILAQLNEKKSQILVDLKNVAANLSALRKKGAATLAESLLPQVRELGMKNAEFEVQISFDCKDESAFSHTGCDEIEFLFSANLGQPVKPLNKIISGGELSRLMLALKSVVKSINANKSYIFDEIDTGIGGDIGGVVAKKIAQISLSNQVLCVTHLPQIASFATTNYKVEKTERDNNTKTHIKKLSHDEKVLEITRMIGNLEHSNFANLHAMELIATSKKYYENIS